ncbi:probable secreted protein [Salmonella enterica]|nr:probable secreted protein [Salmonella enterica]
MNYLLNVRFRSIGPQTPINDNDGRGVALLAWPMHYGETGVMSFLVNQDDRIYQADLGKDTESNVRAITRFAPDARWQAAE